MVAAILDLTEASRVFALLPAEVNPHYALVGERELKLFGMYGKVNGDTWEISEEGSPEAVASIHPCPFSNILTFLVNAARDRHPDTSVSYIMINARIGLYLFLEGLITPEHFRRGSWDELTIEFDLDLGGQIYSINLVEQASDGEIGAYDDDSVLM